MQNPSEKKLLKFKYLQQPYTNMLLNLDREKLKEIFKTHCPQDKGKTPLNEIFTAIENNSYNAGYIFPTRHWRGLSFVNNLSTSEVKLLRSICQMILDIPKEEDVNDYIIQFQNLIQGSRFTSSSIIPHALFEDFKLTLGENYEGEFTSEAYEIEEGAEKVESKSQTGDQSGDEENVSDEAASDDEVDEENDSEINITLLSFAVYARNKYIVRVLLNNYGWHFDENDQTTSMIILAYQLSYALDINNIEIAELLLTQGKADPLHCIEGEIDNEDDLVIDKDDLSLLQIALLENPPIFKIMLQVFPHYLYQLQTPRGHHSITSVATLKLLMPTLNFLLESGYSTNQYKLNDEILNPLSALIEHLENLENEEEMLMAIGIMTQLLLLGDMYKLKEAKDKIQNFFNLAYKKINDCLSEDNLRLANIALDLIYFIANSAAYNHFPTEFKNSLINTATVFESKRNRTTHLDLKERCLSVVRFSAIFKNTPVPSTTLPLEINQQIFKPIALTWQAFIVQLFTTIHRSNNDNKKLTEMKMNHILYNMEKNFPTDYDALVNKINEYSNSIENVTEMQKVLKL